MATGRFERTPAAGAEGNARQGFPQVHYIPDRKQFLVVGTRDVHIYEPGRKLWSSFSPQGPAPRGADRPGCYDPKRHRVYSGDGDGLKGETQGLMACDIDGKRWIDLKHSGTAPPADNTNGMYYEYDPHHDLVIAISF